MVKYTFKNIYLFKIQIVVFGYASNMKYYEHSTSFKNSLSEYTLKN